MWNSSAAAVLLWFLSERIPLNSVFVFQEMTVGGGWVGWEEEGGGVKSDKLLKIAFMQSFLFGHTWHIWLWSGNKSAPTERSALRAVPHLPYPPPPPPPCPLVQPADAWISPHPLCMSSMVWSCRRSSSIFTVFAGHSFMQTTFDQRNAKVICCLHILTLVHMSERQTAPCDTTNPKTLTNESDLSLKMKMFSSSTSRLWARANRVPPPLPYASNKHQWIEKSGGVMSKYVQRRRSAAVQLGEEKWVHSCRQRRRRLRLLLPRFLILPDHTRPPPTSAAGAISAPAAAFTGVGRCLSASLLQLWPPVAL